MTFWMTLDDDVVDDALDYIWSSPPPPPLPPPPPPPPPPSFLDTIHTDCCRGMVIFRFFLRHADPTLSSSILGTVIFLIPVLKFVSTAQR